MRPLIIFKSPKRQILEADWDPFQVKVKIRLKSFKIQPLESLMPNVAALNNNNKGATGLYNKEISNSWWISLAFSLARQPLQLALIILLNKTWTALVVNQLPRCNTMLIIPKSLTLDACINRKALSNKRHYKRSRTSKCASTMKISKSSSQANISNPRRLMYKLYLRMRRVPRKTSFGGRERSINNRELMQWIRSLRYNKSGPWAVRPKPEINLSKGKLTIKYLWRPREAIASHRKLEQMEL